MNQEVFPFQQTSVVRAALLCRCPRCGRGAVYEGLLKVRSQCSACGLDLRGHDSGDGPVFFVLSFLCLVAVVGALVLEFTVHPPLWLQAAGWGLALPIWSLLLLRPVKALMIASQYRLLGTEVRDAASSSHGASSHYENNPPANPS